MSNIADITVFDGASTPVSHTLKAIDVTRENGKIVANWRENIAALPVYAQIRATATLEQLKSGVYKTDFRVVVPVMESVSGQNSAGYTAAPKVAYEETVGLYGFHHQRSTVTDRRLTRQMLVNLGNNVSTSVAAATAGFLPELFDQLISAT